jgi:hypothetical protein
MTMARYNLVIQDGDGNIINGASVEVRNEATTSLAALKSDRAGSVGISNPFTAANGADAGFYVVGGAYKVRVYTGASGAPTFERILRYVAIGLSSETDTFVISGAFDVPQAITFSGDITPTQLSANTNDYAPTGFSTSNVVRISTDASRNITGLAGGADGRLIHLLNVGSFSAVLKDEDANSTAANRFGFGADQTLATKQGATLIYDATASRWRLVGCPPATAGAVSSIAGNTGAFTLSGGITNSTNDIRLDPAFGGWKLLATLTASASATLSDTTNLTSTYKEYEIVLTNILPATNAVNFTLQVHSGGSFQATSYLDTILSIAGSTTVSFTSLTTALPLDVTAHTLLNTGPGFSGNLRVSNPSGTSAAKNWTGQFGYPTGSVYSMSTLAGMWNNTAAITGFQVQMSSGNIASGTIRIYGRN